MKRILYLLLVLISIKINAYQYLINSQPNRNTYRFYTDVNGKLYMEYQNNGTSSYFGSDSNFYDTLNKIGKDTTFISKSKFYEYYKNDLIFLNDLYTQRLQPFLNYLYNNNFNSSNHVNYESYQILYNEDGLAVESIINGNWAGLYDGPDNSGFLYNEKGDLLYKNGVPVSFLEKINNKILKKFKINLESIFIKKIFYPLLVLIFACVIFRSVIRMAFKAFLIRFYDKKIGQLEKRREKIENA